MKSIMSKSHRLFGRSKGGRSGRKGENMPTTGEAIQSLRETEEMLNKKQQYLEKKIETEVANARRNAKINKTAALAAIKRKKRYERQLQQIDGTLTTIEQQRETLESASTNTAVLTNMGQAAKALKKAQGDMDVDRVHDLMDDIAEQQDVAREISDAISNPVAFGHEFDEDELEAELNDLEAELELDEQKELDDQLLNVGPAPAANLPEVPTAEPVSARTAATKPKQADDEMAELAAWAS